MLRSIDDYIPLAVTAIQDFLCYRDGEISTQETKEGIVPGDVNKKYQGYLASFGPSVLQAGLLPTLAFCGTVDKGSKHADRAFVLEAIMSILRSESGSEVKEQDHLLKYILKKAALRENPQRLTQADLDETVLTGLEDQILGVVVALKLALRIFPLKETKS